MLVPLYEAVHRRLDVGTGTRLLGLGCGSGLALLMAASRGAAVTGVDSGAPERTALARERLQTEAWATRARRGDARVVEGVPGDAARTPGDPLYNLVTAFEPIGCLAGDSEGLGELLASATPLAERGTPVVLMRLGPAGTLHHVRRAPCGHEARRSPAQRGQLAPGTAGRPGGGRPAGRPEAGRFRTRGLPLRVRQRGQRGQGLLSTGLFDAAIRATDQAQVDKELTEALHPHRRRDGTVWMPNVFRYLITRTR